jgi:8-oxo-dGTP pyrophosphatase MutT (NUDIX family)
MKRAMAAAMRRAAAEEAGVRVPYNPTHTTELPQWLFAA